MHWSSRPLEPELLECLLPKLDGNADQGLAAYYCDRLLAFDPVDRLGGLQVPPPKYRLASLPVEGGTFSKDTFQGGTMAVFSFGRLLNLLKKSTCVRYPGSGLSACPVAESFDQGTCS